MVNFEIVDRKGLYCFINNLYNLHNHHYGECLFFCLWKADEWRKGSS